MKRLNELLDKLPNLNLEESSLISQTKTPDKCDICRNMGFVRKDVPFGHPDFGKAFPCPHKLTNAAGQSSTSKESSGLAELAHMTFDSFDADSRGLSPDRQLSLRLAYEYSIAFARRPKNWLVLKGSYGVGKTHLAAAIGNYRMSIGQPVLFILVPDFLDHLRSSYAPTSEVTFDERFESVRTAELLILDDLGSHSATAWAQEKLFQLLNYRYISQLPTVITTNLKLEELDPRLRSRLSDAQISHILHIAASDYRKKTGANQEPELSTLALHQDQQFSNFDLREEELSREEFEKLRRVVNGCKKYADTPDGWLVITGAFGSGKTHLAAAIANSREQQGENVLFVVVPDLLDYLRATFNPNSAVSFDRRFEEVRSSSFLVLDDLGTESATAWAKEKLFQILNYRYVARLPTVFTTPTLVELEPRLKSRMYDETRCAILGISAPSFHNPEISAPINQYQQTQNRSGSPQRGKRKKPSNE